jgi:ABC-2 type transport system ATP-binding protein
MSASPAVLLEELTKSFQVKQPVSAGFWPRVRGAFAPRYEAVRAVDGVSFRIEAGERVAFIGPNGAGKSTTLKMLTGILHPDTGRGEVLGLVPWRDRRALGYRTATVFGQRSQLWYQLPARDTLDLLSYVYELPRATYRQRLAELAELFELAPLLDKPVRTLSLGQRMRCEIAASLLHRPEILFLDEPTIGLDVAAKARIRELLLQKSATDGTTLLFTSHDTLDIELVCDRVIVIHHGRVLLDGPLADLKRRLQQKRVTLLTNGGALRFELAGVSVIEEAPLRMVLEVATDITPVGAVVEAALRTGSVRDLSIEDPPLETSIRALYAQARAELA